MFTVTGDGAPSRAARRRVLPAVAAGEPPRTVRRHPAVFISKLPRTCVPAGSPRRSVDRYRHHRLHQIATGALHQFNSRQPLPAGDAYCGAVTGDAAAGLSYSLPRLGSEDNALAVRRCSLKRVITMPSLSKSQIRNSCDRYWPGA